MSKLEQYIKSNKQSLEPENLEPHIWLEIENKMLKKKHKRKYLSLVLLTLASILLVTSFFVFKEIQNKELDEQRILADLNLSQYGFTQQIANRKQNLVKLTLPQDNVEDLEILLTQVKFLDEQFQDYKKYIEQNGYQDFIAKQILNLYQSKIELLDKIEQEVKKINYYESIEPSVSAKVNIEI